MHPLHVRLIPMLVGMLAAVQCAGIGYIRVTPGAVPVVLAVARSLSHVLLCMAVAAVANAVMAVGLARRNECPVWWQGTLLTATAAAWLPPLWTFLSYQSVFAIIPALAIVFTLSRPWHTATPSLPTHAGRMALSLCASVVLQLALVGLAIGEIVLTVGGLALACVLLVLRVRVASPRVARPATPWRVRWTVNSASASAMLTIVLLSGQLLLQSMGFAQKDVDLRDVLDLLFNPKSAAAESRKGRPGNADQQRSHPGIILHLENAVNVAVAPPAPRPLLESGVPSVGRRDDTIIPFAGVYWFYILPDQQPPPESPVLYGSPDLKRYLSVEHLPVRMEARQNLGRAIGLNCCKRIDMSLRNADRYLGTVEIELIVADTRSGHGETMSLGKQPVRSRAQGFWKEQARSVGESLSFEIPPARAMLGFDELRVVFHTLRVREDSSPKIAIEHFALVPAGL